MSRRRRAAAGPRVVPKDLTTRVLPKAKECVDPTSARLCAASKTNAFGRLPKVTLNLPKVTPKGSTSFCRRLGLNLPVTDLRSNGHFEYALSHALGHGVQVRPVTFRGRQLQQRPAGYA